MIRADAAVRRVIPVPSIELIAFGGISALLLGAALAWNATIGFGLAIVLMVGVAVVLRPVNILGVLIAAVFLELITIGGVAVTRLIAPIALLVVIAAAVGKETGIRWSPPLGWAIAYAVWALASGLWTESVDGTAYSLASLMIALMTAWTFRTVPGARPSTDNRAK